MAKNLNSKKKVRIATNFWPWHPVGTILSNAEIALKHYPYDTFYMCDEYQYTDPFTVLAAVAMKLSVSVGTSATFPSRNPLYIAQKITSIAELLPDGKEAVLGFASGGGVQRQVMLGHPAPVSITEEAVKLLCRLLGGEVVGLSEYPNLARKFGFNREGKAKLYFPPSKPIPVCVAAGGRKMMEVAARYGDGLLLTQLHPVSNLGAMRVGLFKETMDIFEKTKAESSNSQRPFRKIFNFHISVSKDRIAARQLARRQTSYSLATFIPLFPKELERVGFPLDEIQKSGIRDAYVKAIGVELAAERVTERLLDHAVDNAGFLAAGSPKECIEKCREIAGYLKEAGFDEIILGVPLGPDMQEALEIIGKEIAPAVKEVFD